MKKSSFGLDENSLIVKDNSLVVSRYNLSLAEQKFILQVVSMIEKDDEDFKDYEVKVTDYLDLIKSNSDNMYIILKNFADSLLKKPLHIPQKDGGFFACNWFAGLKYESKRGILKCSFHPVLKPFLLRLKKNFTAYKLKNILQLSSKYSIRLYEIMKCYEHLGQIAIKLDDFKKMLSIPDKYKYGHIKNRILKPLQREFLKYTDISYSFKEMKKQRKVEAICFTITKNMKAVEEDKNKSFSTKKWFEEVQNYDEQKIKELLNMLPGEEQTQNARNVLAKYLQNYDYEYIKNQVKYTNKQKPKNFIAYLKRAIEEDYLDIEKEKLKEMKKQKMIDKKIEELKNKMENNINLAVEREQALIYKEYMDLLDEDGRNNLLQEYLLKVKKLNPDMAKNKHLMEINAKILIIQDIISKNEIYKIRLEKVRSATQKQAEKDFEDSKRKLYVSIESN
jgi:plasmid replication initiation protein